MINESELGLPKFTALQDCNVLVTGGAGFIGTRLVAELLRQGSHVKILSRKPAPTDSPWPGAVVEWICGDLSTAKGMDRICDGVQVIFHLAGPAHMIDNTKNLWLHHQITVNGTTMLMDKAQKNGVQCLVFLSSIAAMGESGQQRLDESSPEVPKGEYGHAKLEAERLLLDVGKRTGMHVTVLRAPLVYGPGSKGNLPRMIQAISARRFPPLPDLRNNRPMVHVDDLIQAMLLAVVNKQADGKIYIITDGDGYSSSDIDRLIRFELGWGSPRWHVPMWLLRMRARLGDVMLALRLPAPLHTDALRKLCDSAWYSNERISRELGYKPRFNLQSSLPQMVAECTKSSKSYSNHT